MDDDRDASATSNESKYMSKRARRAATSRLHPQIWIKAGSELKITTLSIVKRLNSDFFDICWTTKMEKGFQALQSTVLILRHVPCSFPFFPPFRPPTLLVLHLCPPAATPLHPVSTLSDSPPSCPRTFGSRLVKGGENRIHPRVPMPKGLDIIYLYLHLLLLRYRKRMKSWDGANRNVSPEPSHIETSYSRVSWWQWTNTVSNLCVFKAENNGIEAENAKSFKDTGHSRLPSRRGGCQTLSPQWSVGKGGGRWEEASGWSGIDI